MCFKVEKGVLGRILVSDNAVHVDWDLSDDAGNTEEYGGIEERDDIQGEVRIKTYLQGVLDGSDFLIVLNNKKVTFIPLWSDGTPTGGSDDFRVVNCPKD